MSFYERRHVIMLKKKKKKEIKELVSTIEHNTSRLATLRLMSKCLTSEKKYLDPDKWVDVELNVLNEITKVKNALKEAKARLSELGVY